MKNSEKFNTPQGQIGFILHRGGTYDPQTNTIKGGEILAEKEVKNLIVESASVLMARRLAPGDNTTSPVPPIDYEPISGLKYLAVGVGLLEDPSLPYDPITNPVSSAWNLQNPTEEKITDTALVGELFRKEFTSWSFLDNDLPVSNPTNVLRLVTTFDVNEATGPLTEMGLFGGDATEAANSGIMFNYKTFAVWNKPADSQLTITWKLTF